MQKTSDNTKGRIFTIPNILSFVRLAMIPVICYSYLYLKSSLITCILLFISGLTDVVDGYIARHFNMISDLGKALDPLADKLTQFAVLLCLVSRFSSLMLLAVLLVVKEIINALGNILVTRKTGVVYGAEWHGKLNTVILYSTMVTHLVWYNIPKTVSLVLIVLSVTIMIISCVLYIIRNVNVLKEKK